MEHMFMQILDQEEWIKSQLKQQSSAYDVSVASDLLADGKRLPPCICTEGSDRFDLANPKAPNRYRLSSGLLNQLPWAITPSANNSAYFTLPTFNIGNTTQIQKVTEILASDKYTSAENGGKAMANANTLHTYGNVEPDIVEDSVESDSPVRIQRSACSPGYVNYKFSEKVKASSSLGENRFKAEHTSQTNHSKVSSVKNDVVKETLDMNLHDLVPDGVTRFLSCHNDCLDKLLQPSKVVNCVGDIPSRAAENETDLQLLRSEKNDNIARSPNAACSRHSCEGMPCVVDTKLPDTFPLVEPKKLSFDRTDEYDLVKDIENPSAEKACDPSGLSISNIDTRESVKDVLTCKDLEKIHCSEKDNSRESLETDRILHGVSENVIQLLEQHDPKFHSQPSSGHQSVAPDVQSVRLLQDLVNEEVEGQCSTQQLESEIVGCLETNTLVEPDIGLSISCFPSILHESKGSASVIGVTEIDIRQSSGAKLSDVSIKSLSPLAGSPLLGNDDLPTDVMTTEGAVEVSSQVLETLKLSEALESESALHPTPKREQLHGYSNSSLELLHGQIKSAPTCSSSITKCIASKWESLRTQVEYETGDECTEELIKETSSCPLQLVNAPHSNGFLDSDKTETSACQTMARSTLQAKPTPISIGTDNKMQDLQHSTRNSNSNRNIAGTSASISSVVPSSNKTTASFSAQGTVENLSVLKSSPRKRPYDLASHSERSKVRYFLRSSTSNESIWSLQDVGSPSRSKNNSIILENSACQTTVRSALQAKPAPLFFGMDNTIQDLQHRTSNSSSNGDIAGTSASISSVIPSSDKTTASFSAQGTVENLSVLKLSPRKRSYDLAIHSEQSKLRFLRSSTSNETIRSLQNVGSPSCSKNNTVILEAEDASVDPVTCQISTPNGMGTGNAQSKPRYFLRSNHLESASSNGTGFAESIKISPDACEITWPKRRKIDIQSHKIYGTSRRLRHVLRNQEGNNRKYHTHKSPPLIIDSTPVVSETETRSSALKSPLKLLNESKSDCIIEERPSLEDVRPAVFPFSGEDIKQESYADLGSGIFLNDEIRVPELWISELQKMCTSDDGDDSLLAQKTLEHEILTSPSSSQKLFTDTEMYSAHVSLRVQDTVESAHYDTDVVGSSKNSPEFEGFIIPSVTDNYVVSDSLDYPSLQNEHISALEQLHKANHALTPVSTSSSKYKMHEVPDVSQSLSSGFLERKHFSCTPQFKDTDMHHLKYSVGDEFASIRGSFSGHHNSQSLPCSYTREDSVDKRMPLSPHFMKFCEKDVSGTSASSSERIGSNPELVCFRIDENSPIADYNEHVGLGSSQENVFPKETENLQNRKTLTDVTREYQNASETTSDLNSILDRDSLVSISDSCNWTRNSSYISFGSGYPSKTVDKENADHSVNRNRVRKAAMSRNKFSKPRKAEKVNKIRSLVTSGGGYKPLNIISNISSFIPFVRQKQKADVPLKGKKDIKVKALEAAEAAKRLEEKKQNEREMRKVAAKLERERLEQENLKKAALKQKQKEEDKKRKEAEIAARKRQREEEEKKERGRKKRCIEERRQQKERLEKSCAIKVEKELQCKALDLKQPTKQNMEVGAKQQLKAVKNGGDTRCQVGTNVQPETMKVQAVGTSYGSDIPQGADDSKKSIDFRKLACSSAALHDQAEKNVSVSGVSQEIMSYEMSPLRDSDDEDEDETRREGKYIPPWARRESLQQIILSKLHMDGKIVFGKKLSFSLNEVLPTRILQRPFY